ncbi:MAG: hypothetical protein WC474_06630 [Hydrogenophilaceae bacterium]
MNLKAWLPLLICVSLLPSAHAGDQIRYSKVAYVHGSAHSLPESRSSERMGPARLNAASWRELVEGGRFDRLPYKIMKIRVYFDALAWRDSVDLWGDPKHWGSLPELMEKGAATPRDLSAAYYVTLRAMGVPSADMRILLGTVPRLDEADRRVMRPRTLLLVRSGAEVLYIDPLNWTDITTRPPNGFANGLAVNEEGEWMLANRAIHYAWGAASGIGTYLPAWAHAWEESKPLMAWSNG